MKVDPTRKGTQMRISCPRRAKLVAVVSIFTLSMVSALTSVSPAANNGFVAIPIARPVFASYVMSGAVTMESAPIAGVFVAIPIAEPVFVSDASARFKLDTTDSTQRRNYQGLRDAMYASQVADALVTGTAVKHGATGRTMFGTANAAGYLVSSAAFDALIGAFTRRVSWRTKSVIDFALGSSALLNAMQDRQ